MMTGRRTLPLAKERGFTLIEMLVVMLVVAMLMTLSLLSASELMPRWRLRQAAADVASSIGSARAAAVINQAEVVMSFDVDRNSYEAVTRAGASRLVDLPGGIRFSRPTSGAAVTLSPPASGGDTAAKFGSTGLLVSTNLPGDVYVGIPGKNLYRRVRVSMAGTVSTESWDGSVWRRR
jgi:prepilin-type N-terminal cleavage/methylation domain-containing protein